MTISFNVCCIFVKKDRMAAPRKALYNDAQWVHVVEKEQKLVNEWDSTYGQPLRQAKISSDPDPSTASASTTRPCSSHTVRETI
jgi:hypothetical protein